MLRDLGYHASKSRNGKSIVHLLTCGNCQTSYDVEDKDSKLRVLAVYQEDREPEYTEYAIKEFEI